MNITLNNIECFVVKTNYSNDRISLLALKVGSGEQYAVLTVNLPNTILFDNQIIIDINIDNVHEVIPALIESNYIDIEPDFMVRSGLLLYPVYTLLN